MSGKKAAGNAGPKFQFIISDGKRGPEDPDVRTLIRKQAMRDVGLARRRRSDNHGRSSGEEGSASPSTSTQASTPSDGSVQSVLGTVGSKSSYSPPDESLVESDDFHSSTDGWSEFTGSSDEQTMIIRSAAQTAFDLELPPLLYFPIESGYDKVRSTFGIDISSLSALTDFKMGRAAMPLLSADPARLVSLFELQRESYLQHIPARYDRSPCLAAATDCVLAKAASVLFPTLRNGQMAARLYAKALRRVQDAISDPVASTEPEVLGAVKLLSLHELLDSTRGDAWSHHVAGAAHLIKHRSPSRFETGFERALLAAHAGAIVSETMMRNLPCYLAQPQWTEVLYKLGRDTEELTDRSPLILNIRVKMMGLPGLWHDLDEFMNSERLFDDEALERMEERCKETHTVYMEWLDEYNDHCVQNSFRQLSPDELELRREIFGTVCECMLLAKRFWACLADDKRLQLELESQALAQLITGLCRTHNPKLSWLFTTHEIAMAKATRMTQDAFEEDSRDLSAFEKRLACRRRYNLLCRKMRGMM